MGGLERSGSRLGRVGEHIGRGIRTAGDNIRTLGVIAGGIAVAGITASIHAASDLNESLSKVQVVFGDLSDEVINWSKNSAQAMGLSQQAALETASSFGNLFTAMHIAQPESAKMSEKLVELAGDLASFNNLDPEEVLVKLRSGIVGEAEPLRTLGIQISAARTEAEAAELGFKKVNGQFTAGQKAIANYNIILKDSTKAQGDFGRTSSGLANQQRILKANLDNTAAILGNNLTPVVAKLAQKVNDLIVKNQPAIAEFAKQLPAAFDKLISIGEKLPWQQIGASLQLAGKGAKLLFDAFVNMPAWVQTAVLTGWGLNKLTGGALTGILGEGIKGAFGQFASRGASAANPLWVQQVGGVAGAPGGVLGGGKGFWAGLGATFGIAAAAIIGERIVDDIQTGFNNARTVREGGVPTPGTVTPATIGPTVELNRDLFRAIGQLGINLSAGGDLANEINKIPETLRDDVVNAILHNPTQQQALHLTTEQIRYLDLLDGKLDFVGRASDKTSDAAAQSNKNERDLISEAKAGRLATAHGAATTAAALKTLEGRLTHDPNFKPKVDSVTEFINLLKRTSEFGAKGVGTTIEQGRKTGRDPVGDAFVALVDRLDKKTLKNNAVQGEISRHIKALEQVQGRLLRQGNVQEARHAQQNINHLERLIGEVDKTIPHFKRIADQQQQTKLAQERGSQKTSGLLGDLLGTSRDTKANTATIARKDFSPRVAVDVHSNTSVSVNDVVRAVNTYSYAVNTYGAKIGNLPTG